MTSASSVKFARRILEEMDFQIIEAEDGEKALEACKRSLPDAILLDWNMPVMDGYEFLGSAIRMQRVSLSMIPASFAKSRAASWKRWISRSSKPRTARQALEVCKRGACRKRSCSTGTCPSWTALNSSAHLRRMPGGDAPKVVFCTTENGIDHIARAMNAGANEYIMKPFDKDIVAAKFQEVGLIAVPA